MKTKQKRKEKGDSQDNLYQKFTKGKHINAPEVRVTHFILGEDSKGLTTFRTVFLFI
jgi:hypothetical protein